MKIKGIAQICKKNKIVYLLDDVQGDHISQWIGDGHALYPISGLPYLDKGSVFTIFDIPEKDRDKWFFAHNPIPKEYSFEDTFTGEQFIEKDSLGIAYAGRALLPMRTRHGMEFIEGRYLSPLANVLDAIELYERETSNGQTYIAVKTGFLIAAVILPYDIISTDFVKKLQELTKQCAKALLEKELKKQFKATEPKQFAFAAGTGVDMETGEVLDDPEDKESKGTEDVKNA